MSSPRPGMILRHIYCKSTGGYSDTSQSATRLSHRRNSILEIAVRVKHSKSTRIRKYASLRTFRYFLLSLESATTKVTSLVQEIKQGAHLLEVNRGAAEILCETSPVSLHQAEVIVGLRQPLGRRERVPPGSLSQVFAHSQAVLVCHACLGQ